MMRKKNTLMRKMLMEEVDDGEEVGQKCIEGGIIVEDDHFEKDDYDANED